jgi:hypothetical protein
MINLQKISIISFFHHPTTKGAMMKKTLKWAALLMTCSLFTPVFSPLIAAQGQITEVNPSGMHGGRSAGG